MNIINNTDLYRLPWNLADNAISWLEPTSCCNLHCDGCYRENRNLSHKSLDEIKKELDVFEKLRKTDGISIAGGEPLLHPLIADIVRIIADRGWKAIINTNGIALTDDLLSKLKDSGLSGFTFHIDSGQNRPGWKDKNELELNELRLHFAEKLSKTGGISCAFNSTVYPETMQYVPAMTKWAQEHIDIVHIMVFIIYRMAIFGKNLDFYTGDKKVYFDDMTYSTNDDNRRTNVSSVELVDLIKKEAYPDFTPCAFLNGSEKVDTYKWLLTGRLGNKNAIFGYAGRKFMEAVQIFKHLKTDKYLAYSSPSIQRRGRLFFLLSPIDKGIRSAAANYFKSFMHNPRAFFSKVHYQTVLIIQPADIYSDGRVNMCDGCPDMTVWNGQLVWSCRMEEQYRWGQNVRVVPQSNGK